MAVPLRELGVHAQRMCQAGLLFSTRRRTVWHIIYRVHHHFLKSCLVASLVCAGVSVEHRSVAPYVAVLYSDSTVYVSLRYRECRVTRVRRTDACTHVHDKQVIYGEISL